MKTPLVKRNFPGAKPYIKDHDYRMAQLATPRQVAGALGISVTAALRICRNHLTQTAYRDDPNATMTEDRLLYSRAEVIAWAETHKAELAKIRTRVPPTTAVNKPKHNRYAVPLEERCGGNTRSGDRCRARVLPGTEFCAHHQKDATVLEPQTFVDGIRCTAVTRSGPNLGKQCLSPAQVGSEFCPNHSRFPSVQEKVLGRKTHLLREPGKTICGRDTTGSDVLPLVESEPTCGNCKKRLSAGPSAPAKDSVAPKPIHKAKKERKTHYAQVGWNLTKCGKQLQGAIEVSVEMEDVTCGNCRIQVTNLSECRHPERTINPLKCSDCKRPLHVLSDLQIADAISRGFNGAP